MEPSDLDKILHSNQIEKLPDHILAQILDLPNNPGDIHSAVAVTKRMVAEWELDNRHGVIAEELERYQQFQEMDDSIFL